MLDITADERPVGCLIVRSMEDFHQPNVTLVRGERELRRLLDEQRRVMDEFLG